MDFDRILSFKDQQWRTILIQNEDGFSSIPQEELIGIDTETEKIVDGEPIRPVLVQVGFHSSRQVHLVPYEYWEKYQEHLHCVNPVSEWVFHNFPFDFFALGGKRNKILMHKLLRKQFTDTGIRYLLSTMKDGDFRIDWRLDTVVKHLLGVVLSKDESIRLTFVQGMEFSEAHLEYAAMDVIATLNVRNVLSETMPTEYLQSLGHVALTECGRNGLFVDKEKFEELSIKFKREMDTYAKVLAVFGYYPNETDNTAVLQDLLVNIEERLNSKSGNAKKIVFPRTAKKKDYKGRPAISMTDELIAMLPSGSHPMIGALKHYKHAEKMLSTYLNPDMIGTDARVHPYFEIIVKTGRTSCKRPNVQNMPRGDGIRGIYRAPYGFCFVAYDYSQLELCTLSESCYRMFGVSRMRELINQGVGLHDWFGNAVKERSSTQNTETVDFRQMAKAANFGLPGGLGVDTFITYARSSYGVDITRRQAEELKKLWLESFPEMEQHLKGKADPQFPGMYIAETITGRIRSNSDYCSALNTRFQGLASDGAKFALFDIWRAGYKIVNFIHDEIIVELPIDSELNKKALKVGELMIKGMRRVTPNTSIKVEGAMFVQWNKKAKGVYGADGEMKIWTPDIITPSKEKTEEKELLGLPKEDVERVAARTGYRLLWADEHLSKFYGWQPSCSVLN